MNHNAPERSLESLKKNCKRNEFGVAHEPLLEIDLSNVIIDELHLMLRVTDILIRNLMWEVIYQDDVNAFRDKTKKSAILNKTVNCIRSCGLTFQV